MRPTPCPVVANRLWGERTGRGRAALRVVAPPDGALSGIRRPCGKMARVRAPRVIMCTRARTRERTATSHDAVTRTYEPPLRAHSGRTLGALRAHSGRTPGALRAHSGRTPGALRAHSGANPPTPPSRTARQHRASRAMSSPLRALRGVLLEFRPLLVRPARHLEQRLDHPVLATLGQVDRFLCEVVAQHVARVE